MSKYGKRKEETKAMKRRFHVVTVLCLRYLTTQLLLQVLTKTLNRKHVVLHLRLCLRFGPPCCPNGIRKLFQQCTVEAGAQKRSYTLSCTCLSPAQMYKLKLPWDCLAFRKNWISNVTNTEFEIVIIRTSRFFYLRIVLGHYCCCTLFLRYQGN